MGTVYANFTRYRRLPLNPFERVELVNTVVMPRWTHYNFFGPTKALSRSIDTMCLSSILAAQGMEHNSNTYSGPT